MSTGFDADVIVIGSGAVGSNAAYELAKQGKSVILLEAGERMPRWKLIQNFHNTSRRKDNIAPFPNKPWAPTSAYDGYIVNTGNQIMTPGQLKLVGGTTWHWGGAAWRLIPSDFKLKSLYGVGRDWPIDYDDLERYYARAEAEIGVAGDNSEDQAGNMGRAWPPRSTPYPLPREVDTYYAQRIAKRIEPHGYRVITEPSTRASAGYRGRPACVGNNNCLPACPIGANYSGFIHAELAEQAGARLLTDATAFKLEKGPNGKIAAVHYRNSKGEDTRLTARTFVVAAHAYESAKLLLMSHVGNSSDQVGRNLMPHLALILRFLADEPLWPGRGPIQGNAIMNLRDGDFRRHRASNKYQLSMPVANEFITTRLLQQGVLGSELDHRIRHDSARFVEMFGFWETLPQASNRVTLGQGRTVIGLPTMSVHYDLDDYSRNTAPVVRQDFEQFIKAMGGTDVMARGEEIVAVDHIMGTVIMGDDPKTSVVDKDCRSWDHENLFVVGTGNIPACSAVNPTLTGIALAIRAADRIATEV
ncbi:GMC family oxidoreductase [Paraburkholderia sp. J94]|uniref:GMC family oxidoreductase n=1 Tax=Paraburkholderia sp. J94 TaxID=2805441 RepID=UPI002AB06B74|nr:GMC family oxidoreductase [Paraburkholderia sp. J94]